FKRRDLSNNRALRFGQAINFCKLVMHGVQSYSEISAFYFALADQLLVDEIGFIGRQSEADAIVIAGRRRDLRIHADHFTTHVDEWSTTVAAIDGGVSLQKTLEDVEVRALTFFLRNDSGCHGLIQTKRRTHRQHPIADLRCVRVAESYGWKVLRRVDLDHGNVGFTIEADNCAA